MKKTDSLHIRSLARLIFNYFAKKYGDGHFTHGHIRNQIDFIQYKIDFEGVRLRFCMFMKNDETTYLTVFHDDGTLEDHCQDKLLILMSSLENDKNAVTEIREVQYIYNYAYPPESFISEVYNLFSENSELKEKWPRKTSEMLRVA